MSGAATSSLTLSPSVRVVQPAVPVLGPVPAARSGAVCPLVNGGSSWGTGVKR